MIRLEKQILERILLRILEILKSERVHIKSLEKVKADLPKELKNLLDEKIEKTS